MRFKKGIKSKDVIVKCAADKLLPFSLIFALSVLLFGVSSPGGGFQGGVLVASACLLIYLGYGIRFAGKFIKKESLERHEALGAIIYVLLGALGLVFGVAFCQNIFADIAGVGDFLAGGEITFMSFTVGYKVLTGLGFLLLLLLGLPKPGDDDYEEDDDLEEEE